MRRDDAHPAKLSRARRSPCDAAAHNHTCARGRVRVVDPPRGPQCMLDRVFMLRPSSAASAAETSTLIAPYGGVLIDLLVPAEACDPLRRLAAGMPAVQVSDRVARDLELLATGALSPLDRFMGQADYHRVLHEMRLGSGEL